jgi:hypothetical protein
MNTLHVPSLQGSRRIDDGTDPCKDAPSISKYRWSEKDRGGCGAYQVTPPDERHQYAFMAFGGLPGVDCRSNNSRTANDKDTHRPALRLAAAVSQTA